MQVELGWIKIKLLSVVSTINNSDLRRQNQLPGSQTLMTEKGLCDVIDSSVMSHSQKCKKGMETFQQCMTIFYVSEFQLYHSRCKIGNFSIPPTGLGERSHIAPP